MKDALRLEGVVKRWRGGRRALDGLTFRVPEGSVCGFIGPNGAGKTTTFGVVCGYLTPDEGQVQVLGEGPFDPQRMAGRVGVLPQDAELPDRHSPRELLTHLARLQGIGGAQAASEAARCMDLVDLGDRADDRIGALSHGMRRRVAVASALLGTPELVLLDEPTAGLDPVQARRVRDLLASLRGHHTVVVSSHNLLELESLCDWLVLVEDGRCVGEGTTASMTGQGEVLVWTLTRGLTDAEVATVPGARRHDLAEIRVTVTAGEDVDAATRGVMRALAALDVGLVGMRRGVSLEERVVTRPR